MNPAEYLVMVAASQIRDGHMADEHRSVVSIPKACQMAGVSRRTIYNWIDAGKVKFVRTAGGRVRIFTDSLFRSGNVAVRLHSPDAVPHAVSVE